jgi:hypothetical protein
VQLSCPNNNHINLIGKYDDGKTFFPVVVYSLGVGGGVTIPNIFQPGSPQMTRLKFLVCVLCVGGRRRVFCRLKLQCRSRLVREGGGGGAALERKKTRE